MLPQLGKVRVGVGVGVGVGGLGGRTSLPACGIIIFFAGSKSW